MNPVRMVDASLNRALEGLRVMEDLARFVLEDRILAARAKACRHALAALAAPSAALLASARAAEPDCAAFLDPQSERSRPDLESLLAANLQRCGQALRSLEECAKLPGPPRLDAAAFKRLRFECYGLGKVMTGSLRRRERRRRLHGVYFLLDGGQPPSRLLKSARVALGAGCRLVQLRDKSRGKARQLEMCRRLQALAAEAGALFFVNDHVDLALASGADGVHLGQEDLPVAEARRLLPPGTLVGCSVHDAAEARRAEADGADYVSVGRLFPSWSKPGARPASLATLAAVRRAVGIPVCGIGGIGPDNAGLVARAGADMAAVAGAIGTAEDPAAAFRALRRAFARPRYTPHAARAKVPMA